MSEEKVIIGKDTEYPLEGILSIPDAYEGKLPACVFVHGSGSSNRDEKAGKLTPFKDLAEGLCARGIASLRYDKRSFVHGRKMIKGSTTITMEEETIQDAIMAADILKNDPRIDPERVFVIGHSMGAMLSGRIDAEGGDFRGLIMMAGSLYSLDQILLRQLREQQETGGFLARLVLGKLIGKFEKQFTAMKTMSDEEAKKTKIGNGATLYYFKEMADHPAADYLRDNPKPMLIMQGSDDLQATPASDYKSYQDLLGDHENVTFRFYEGLNHCFVSSLSTNPAKAGKEFSKERHIPSQVIDDIAQFIRDN